MASSKCPGCPSTDFEATSPHKINGYKYPLVFIQCAQCGSVISVLYKYDAGVIAKDNQQVLDDVQKQLKAIEDELRAIQARMNP